MLITQGSSFNINYINYSLGVPALLLPDIQRPLVVFLVVFSKVGNDFLAISATKNANRAKLVADLDMYEK